MPNKDLPRKKIDKIEKTAARVNSSVMFTKNTQKVYVEKDKIKVALKMLFVLLISNELHKKFLYKESTGNLSSFMIEILFDIARDKLEKKINNNKIIDGLISTE